MSAELNRDRLHKQIDRLSDELVEQVADFALFLLVKQKAASKYEDWSDSQWQEFALHQFFYGVEDVDGEDVEYTLKDAREVYRP